MVNTVYVRYDKLRNKEYITYRNEEFVNDFGYPLLDFLYADVKTRYYDIINGATKENHDEIYKKVSNLFNQDDTLVCKLFFYDFERFINESKLYDYSATYRKLDVKTKSYIDIKNEKPFNSLRDAYIRKLLDVIENKQHVYSLILDFCSINTATNNAKIYNRYINKFMYAAKRLLVNTSKPQVTFDKIDRTKSIKNITLEDLKRDYAEKRKEFELDDNPIDDFYYICNEIDDYFITVMFQLFEKHYIISKCKNCGKLFVPFKNNTALYCDRKSPQNPNKTCKEFEGSKPKGLNTLYRKIYQKKFARVSRNKNDYTLKNDFEKWKENAQRVKAKYDNGKITDSEYKEWLIKNDK